MAPNPNFALASLDLSPPRIKVVFNKVVRCAITSQAVIRMALKSRRFAFEV